MALHRGRGFAAINYPIGMNLGGDPSQALILPIPMANSPSPFQPLILAKA